MLTADTITRDQLKALRDEPGAPQSQVATANVALVLGKRFAYKACAEILNARAKAASNG